MDTVIKLNNQSSGRDKLFRLVQYSSKLIWGVLEEKKADKHLIIKLKELENILSTGRKLYRFGRGVDTFYGALSSLHIDNPTLRYTITLSKINMALYLLTDHLLWLGRAGLVDIDKAKWSKLSYKLWLYALVMNLWRDFYEVSQIFKRLNSHSLSHELQFKKEHSSGNLMIKIQLFGKLLALHKDIVVDTVKNGCDLCLPLSQLGYISMSPRMVGLLGAISSLAGILPLLNSSFKLSP